jgi:endonuclease G
VTERCIVSLLLALLASPLSLLHRPAGSPPAFDAPPAPTAQTLPFGLPACSGANQELAPRSCFVLCYDASHKTPAWVGYELTPDHLAGNASRPSRFHRDPALLGASASDDDYRASGFDRGHMAPAADFAWSAVAIGDTFLLSNAVPQDPSLNRGRWAALEHAVRRIAAESGSALVFTGPIYDSPQPASIGLGRVAVPTHLYKVVLAINKDRTTMFAAILPNRPTRAPLDAFATTVDEVERRTGLDFFSGLHDTIENHLEARAASIPLHAAR